MEEDPVWNTANREVWFACLVGEPAHLPFLRRSLDLSAQERHLQDGEWRTGCIGRQGQNSILHGEANGQRWLMLDAINEDVLSDIKTLLAIRAATAL